MKILGLSLSWLLLFTGIVTQGGVLSAFATSVPDSPINLSAIPISSTRVILSWSPSQNNGGASITGYFLEYKTPTTNYVPIAILGNVTTYTHTGLSPGQTYIYKVAAINSAGIGNPSSEAAVSLSSIPLPPRNLVVTAISDTKIFLLWNTPINASGVIGYKIEYKINSGSYTVLVSNTGNFTTYLHSGLTTNTTYTYRISAINSIGAGNTSNEASATTLSTPSAPRNLTSLAVSSSQIKLTWTASSNNGGSPITGYLIKRNDTIIVNNTFSKQTSYIDTNLPSSHQQSYKVAAWNNVGLSSFSNSVSEAINSTAKNSVDNLGQLVSSFVHNRNELLKEQRQETITLIHECHAQIKNALPEDKKQIQQDCKAKIKQLREKYKDLKKQLQEQLMQLKTQFKSQMESDQNEQHSEKELDHFENVTKHSEEMSEEHGNSGNHKNGQHEED